MLGLKLNHVSKRGHSSFCDIQNHAETQQNWSQQFYFVKAEIFLIKIEFWLILIGK